MRTSARPILPIAAIMEPTGREEGLDFGSASVEVPFEANGEGANGEFPGAFVDLGVKSTMEDPTRQADVSISVATGDEGS